MAFYNIVFRTRSEKAREELLGQMSDGWGENYFSFRVISRSETSVIADIEWIDTGRDTAIDAYGKVLLDE